MVVIMVKTRVYVRKVFVCGNSYVVALPRDEVWRVGYGYVQLLVRDRDKKIVIARLRG